LSTQPAGRPDWNEQVGAGPATLVLVVAASEVEELGTCVVVVVASELEVVVLDSEAVVLTVVVVSVGVLLSEVKLVVLDGAPVVVVAVVVEELTTGMHTLIVLSQTKPVQHL